MDYYHSEGIEEFGICKKTHVKEFSLIFQPIVYSITCVFGIIANLTLLVIFVKHKNLRMLLPLQVIISDVLFSLSLPFWSVYASGQLIFRENGCKAITMVFLVSLFSSNLFIASLQIFTSTRSSVIVSLAVWLFSTLAALVQVTFVEDQQSHEENLCTYHFEDKPAWKLYVRLQMTALGFVIPFAMILTSSLRYCVVASRMNRLQMCGMEIGYTVMFFLLWFPYNLVIFLLAFQDIHIVYGCTNNIHLDLAIHVTESIAFMHVFINPLAYMFLNKKVWKRLRNACRSQREYLLEESSGSSGVSDQDGDIELKAVQRFQTNSAERPNIFLPEPK